MALFLGESAARADGDAGGSRPDDAPRREARASTTPTADTSSPRAPRGRLLIQLRQDIAYTSADQPCAPASQAAGDYSCFRENGTQYLGTPVPSGEPAFAGFSVATTRLMAGYERFFGETVSMTGLVGFVLRGAGPTPVGEEAHASFPLHLELDLSVWPAGAPARGTHQVRPFFFIGGGGAQIDASTPITIQEDRDAPPPPSQLDNPDEQVVDVYSRYGTGFVDIGVALEGRLAGPVTMRGRLLGDYLFPAQGAALGLDFGFGVEL